MNKVILMGRLTSAPELRKAQNGTEYLRGTIAVQRDYDKDKADFISFSAFKKTAETIAKFFDKGSPILLEGSWETGSYEKDGTTVYTNTLMVSRFEFIPKNEGKKETTTTTQPQDYAVPPQGYNVPPQGYVPPQGFVPGFNG